MASHTLERKALAANLEEISCFADDALRDFELSDYRRQELMMALDEAITNVVMHSYSKEPGELKVEVRGEGDAVEVELIDCGAAFDPTCCPEPDMNVPLEERKEGGMGVPLMRRFTDGMRYCRQDGRNHLTLIKKKEGATCRTE